MQWLLGGKVDREMGAGQRERRAYVWSGEWRQGGAVLCRATAGAGGEDGGEGRNEKCGVDLKEDGSKLRTEDEEVEDAKIDR